MENVLYELMKDNMWKTVHEKTMENLRNVKCQTHAQQERLFKMNMRTKLYVTQNL